MRFFERLAAHSLSFALSTAIVLGVLATTAGSAAFWVKAAQQSRLYAGLAAAIPGASAAAWQQTIEPLVPRLIEYYAQVGPAPSFNPAALLLAADDRTAIEPISLATSADARIQQVIGYAHVVFIAALCLIPALILGSFGLFRGRAWPLLARAAIWSCLGCLVSAAACFCLPNLAGPALNQTEIIAVRPVILQLIGVLGRAVSLKLAMSAAVLAVAAASLVVIGRLVQLWGRFRPAAQPGQPASTPVRKT